jgi:hypothetical protein
VVAPSQRPLWLSRLVFQNVVDSLRGSPVGVGSCGPSRVAVAGAWSSEAEVFARYI